MTFAQEEVDRIVAKRAAQARRAGRVDALRTVAAALGDNAADTVEDYVDEHGWVSNGR